MRDTAASEASRLLDRLGRLGVEEAAFNEVRAEVQGRETIECLVNRAVLEVPARWRAVAGDLRPTSTLRAPVLAAADELEAGLELRGRFGLPVAAPAELPRVIRGVPTPRI